MNLHAQPLDGRQPSLRKRLAAPKLVGVQAGCIIAIAPHHAMPCLAWQGAASCFMHVPMMACTGPWLPLHTPPPDSQLAARLRDIVLQPLKWRDPIGG